jgi:polygalacturonase
VSTQVLTFTAAVTLFPALLAAQIFGPPIANVSALSVKSTTCGAVGDGATDDSAAFAACIAARPNGGTILVPYSATPYVVKNIALASHITIQFDPGATLIMPTGFNGQTTGMLGSVAVASQLTDIHIKGCTLDGNRANQAGGSGDGAAVGIWVKGWTKSSIEGCVIQNFWTDGIILTGYGAHLAAQACDGITIIGVTITNSRRNGLTVADCKNFKVTNSNIGTSNGTSPQAGVDMEPDVAGETISGCVFENNIIDGNAGAGFSYQENTVARTVNCRISGVFSNNGGAGLNFGGSFAKSGLSLSPVTNGNTGGGVLLAAVTNSVMSGYSINESGTGIYLDTGTTGVMIGSGQVSGVVHDINRATGVVGNSFSGYAPNGNSDIGLNGMFFLGPVGIGIQPSVSLLHIFGVNTAFRIQDSAGTNSGFFSNSGDYTSFATNRNPVSGAVVDATKAVAQIDLFGGVSNSHIDFYTTPTNNVGATFRGRWDKDGNFAIGGATSTWYRCSVAGTLRVGQMTTVAADCGTAVAISFLTP